MARLAEKRAYEYNVPTCTLYSLKELTKLWNKKGVHRVGILFEYRDEKAFALCQDLLEKHYIPMVNTFVTKVVGSRGIVVHEFSSEEFTKS